MSAIFPGSVTIQIGTSDRLVLIILIIFTSLKPLAENSLRLASPVRTKDLGFVGASGHCRAIPRVDLAGVVIAEEGRLLGTGDRSAAFLILGTGTVGTTLHTGRTLGVRGAKSVGLLARAVVTFDRTIQGANYLGRAIIKVSAA